MKKKLFLSILMLALSIIFSFSYTLAADNTAVDGIRNIVGGAENVVEDAAKGITGGVRTGVNSIENAGKDTMDRATTNNDSDYTAQRTATARSIGTTTTNDDTLFGMNSTAWAWITMAILGITIIALVWYYAKQFESTSRHNDDNY